MFKFVGGCGHLISFKNGVLRRRLKEGIIFVQELHFFEKAIKMGLKSLSLNVAKLFKIFFESFINIFFKLFV